MLIQADARSLPLVDGCVQCVVTSPPYFGLRDYGVSGQIGLEPTPDAYVAALVGVFREVRRVLKDDGVCWLNLGDSYSAKPCADGSDFRDGLANRGSRHSGGLVATLKPKDLLGIPWRVAFALQADGWYLRSDIIWSKPNPMPESVTDRPTKAHEYLLLLSKQASYYYDAAAIAEPVSAAMLQEMEQGYDGLGLKDYEAAGVQNPSSVKARIIAGARRKADVLNNGRSQQATNPESERRDQVGTFNNNPRLRPNLIRNRRSVWTIPTMPFNGWSKTSRWVRVSWDESDGDTTRTTSPDCPVHGDRAVQAAKVLCGERADDSLTHSVRTDGGHVSSLLLDSVPILQRPDDYCADGTTDSSGQSHELLATARNNRTRRTGRAPVTTSPCMPSVESPDGTGDTLATQPLSGAGSRRHESSTLDPVGQDVAALAETLGCTVGMCSCLYYRTITENTSHFATMPEALVEPCILAGSRPGDLVLDPFVGSGTVGAVAERFGRRWVGTDLNPAYHVLAKKRTAQRGLRYEP